MCQPGLRSTTRDPALTIVVVVVRRHLRRAHRRVAAQARAVAVGTPGRGADDVALEVEHQQRHGRQHPQQAHEQREPEAEPAAAGRGTALARRLPMGITAQLVIRAVTPPSPAAGLGPLVAALGGHERVAREDRELVGRGREGVVRVGRAEGRGAGQRAVADERVLRRALVQRLGPGVRHARPAPAAVERAGRGRVGCDDTAGRARTQVAGDSSSERQVVTSRPERV